MQLPEVADDGRFILFWQKAAIREFAATTVSLRRSNRTRRMRTAVSRCVTGRTVLQASGFGSAAGRGCRQHNGSDGKRIPKSNRRLGEFQLHVPARAAVSFSIFTTWQTTSFFVFSFVRKRSWPAVSAGVQANHERCRHQHRLRRSENGSRCCCPPQFAHRLR